MKRKAMALSAVFGFLLSLGLPAMTSSGFGQSLEIKNYDGVPYLTGGIGLGEREEMEALTRDYNIKLVFAVQQGNYLSNVAVMVTSSTGGKVLEAVSDGPWLYANLPPGTYTVAATTLGKTISKGARVTAGGRTQLNFVWPGR